MKVYELCRFGKVRDADPEVVDDEDEWGTVVLALHLSEEEARAEGERVFLESEKSAGSSTWIKEARVWAPSRDPADAGRLYLWSMLPSAAPRMEDPNRAFYPQARTTDIWVTSFEVAGEPKVSEAAALALLDIAHSAQAHADSGGEIDLNWIVETALRGLGQLPASE